MRLVILMLLILNCCKVNCQTVADNWYFGNGSGLHFSSTGPSLLFDGQHFNQRNFSLSNLSGELLLYGDQTFVYTREHMAMPNGNIAQGYASNTMFGSFIIPIPKRLDSFYLFSRTIPGLFPETHHLYYSLISMELNDGLGDIVAGRKNIDLIDSVGGHFEYIEKCSGDGHWIVTRNAFNGSIYVFSLGLDGLDTIPQIYSGAVNTLNYLGSFVNGEVEISPDGKNLVFLHRGDSRMECMTFNNQTGEVTNPFIIELDTSLQAEPWGLEFSPSGQYIYATTFSESDSLGFLLQIDVSIFDSISIANSIDTVAVVQSHLMEIQTGPDLKLYTSPHNDSFLHIIHSPNFMGLNCNYDSTGIDLEVYSSMGYLPDFSYRQLLNPIGERIVCKGDTAFFSYDDSCLVALEWDFDDPNGLSGALNANSTYHVFSDTGIYNVALDVEYSAASKHYANQIRVVPNDLPDVFPDTMAVCDSTLKVDISLVDYLWSIGAESPDIHIDSSGWYSVTVSNPCDTIVDSVYAIIKKTLPGFDLPDTSLCEGDTFSVDPNLNAVAVYNWSTGDTNSSLPVSSSLSDDLSPITLWLEASNACNTVSDTATISFLPQPDIGWFSDSVLCDQSFAVVPQPTQKGVDHFMTYTTDDAINDTLPKPWRIDTHGLYYLHAFNQCDTLVKRAFLSPQQVISISLGEDTVLCPGDSVVLNAAWPGSTYLWNSSVSVDQQTDSSVVAYAGDIESEVTYIVTITHPPCQHIASKDISVLPSGCDTFACKFSIPNVFSPNADGINDILQIENSCDEVLYSIYIYNRWGQLVFAEQQRSATSISWDGTINGEDAAEGTYYLIIEQGEDSAQKAVVTIVK